MANTKNTKNTKSTKSTNVEENAATFQHKQRIYNNDTSLNYSLLANVSSPKNAVEASGYVDIDPQTGEILAERPNAFFPIERIGTAFYEVPVGDPLLVRPVRSTDIKQRLIEVFGGDKAKMERVLYTEFEDDDLSEEALLAQLEDEDDYEAQLFNAISDNSPYAVGEDGLTHFERVLKSKGGDVSGYRKWQQMKDIIPKEWQDMSVEDLSNLISSFQQKAASLNQDNTPSPNNDGD